MNECSKCDGKGKIEGFGHVANGTCFACAGTGKLAPASIAEQAKANEAAQAKDAWLAKFDSMSVASVVKMFRANLTWEQCYGIHSYAATDSVAWQAARLVIAD